MNNQDDGVETFIIRVKKSNKIGIQNVDTESLIKSLLQKGSFLVVEQVIQSGKKGKIVG